MTDTALINWINELATRTDRIETISVLPEEREDRYQLVCAVDTALWELELKDDRPVHRGRDSHGFECLFFGRLSPQIERDYEIKRELKIRLLD